MTNSIDIQALNSFLCDIYTVTGIRVSIFNNQFEVITEYPVDIPPVCALVRSKPSGQQACHDCDTAACKRALKLRAPHIYQCHIGLTEAITPIITAGNLVGYAIFAHMIPNENVAAVIEDICECAKRFGLSEEEVRATVSRMQKYSTDKINSSIHILEATVSYLELKKLLALNKSNFASDIDRIIDDNIASKITSETICRVLDMSRTQLYKTCIKTLGVGISEYILTRRIEKSKQLLVSTNKSVVSVAKAVGFEDYNYFCKVFKKNVKMSPTDYRKSNR